MRSCVIVFPDCFEFDLTIMSKKVDIATKEIPEVLCDDSTGKRYTRGRFLGKGGFAKCFEITEVGTKQVLAGKIVPKVSHTR